LKQLTSFETLTLGQFQLRMLNHLNVSLVGMLYKEYKIWTDNFRKYILQLRT